MKLDHVSLHVLNMDAAFQFYRDAFELNEIKSLVARPDIRWLGFSNGTSLHLIPGAPGDAPSTIGDHFAMASPDLDAMMARLREKGIPFGTLAEADGKFATRPDGIRQIYLRDPDNNLVEIKDEERA